MNLEKRLKELLSSQITDFEDNVSAIQFIFSVQKNKKSLFTHSLGLSNPDYWSLVQTFVSEYGSLLSIDSKRNVYSRKINNSYKHQKTKGNKLLFFEEEIEVGTIDKGRKKLNYSDWVNYLGIVNFGQWSLWAVFNNDHLINNNRYRLDAFLILNYYPLQYEKLKIYDFIRQFFLNEGVNIIVNNLFNDIKDHATRAATSRIINRNYAHHIGSHVSHRATADKIFERLFGSYDLSKIHDCGWDVDLTLKSIVEMENRLTRYKDERNEFISGIDSNIQPAPYLFYKDIIQPFIENSLLMDNIAKSEGICWESDDIFKNDGQVKKDGICKLRIRVFYHKNVLDHIPEKASCPIKECCCKKDIPCMHKESEDGYPHDRLSLSDLEVNEDWYEMMALYTMNSSPNGNKMEGIGEQTTNEVCIHRLPYYKKLAADGNGFFESIRYSQDDLEIAIPGTLGTHSIFSLLENHIRNTAKHAPTSTVGSKMPVNIIIKISKLIHKNGSEDHDYYKMELTSNIPTVCDPGQKSKILEGLQEPIDIDTKALGFADMRINASLLAFKEIKQETLKSSIEMPKYYPGNPKNGQSVSFHLLLTRPCNVVFVGETFRNLRTPELEKHGIRQFDTASECIKSLSDKPRAFQFALLTNEVFNDSDNNDIFLKRLPWRVLVSLKMGKCNKSLQKLIKQRRVTAAPDLIINEHDSPEKILAKCWDAWLKNRWQPPYTLNMFFEGNKELDERYGSKGAQLNKNLTYSFNLGSNSTTVFEDEDSFEVFYDRHGSFRDNISANLHKKNISRLAWEHFDKNNPDFDLINNDKLKCPEISFSKLIESGIHKILIIDERAREAGLKSMGYFTYLGEDDEDESGENNPFLRFAMAARVFIADSLLINNEEVLYDTGERKTNRMEKFFQVNLTSKPKKLICFNGKLKSRHSIKSAEIFSKFDTLIIHRTMLSKINDNGLFNTLDENFPNIIITTGGGTLKYKPMIMNRTRMLPYAVVKQYLLNGAIAKNCITNLI